MEVCCRKVPIYLIRFTSLLVCYVISDVQKTNSVFVSSMRCTSLHHFTSLQVLCYLSVRDGCQKVPAAGRREEKDDP